MSVIKERMLLLLYLTIVTIMILASEHILLARLILLVKLKILTFFFCVIFLHIFYIYFLQIYHKICKIYMSTYRFNNKFKRFLKRNKQKKISKIMISIISLKH